MPETEVRRLKGAGFLYDISKIVLDESILEKEGMLNVRRNLYSTVVR
ncbi:hypothetical protein V6C27_06640 [Peptococcaceae bacterium 1198_IL3148]